MPLRPLLASFLFLMPSFAVYARDFKGGSCFLKIVFFLLVGISIGFAQETDDYLLWANAGPESFASSGATVHQSDMDDDENIYVIGSYFKKLLYEPDPTQDYRVLFVFILKYDKDGNIIWIKEFGNSLYATIAGDIRVDNEGNILYTASLYDPEGNVFGQPILGSFLSKLDPDGNIIWISETPQIKIQTYGERIGSFSKQSHMEVDVDNTIVFYYDSNSLGSIRSPEEGLYISRYSPSGVAMNHYQITRDDNFDHPVLGGLTIDEDGNLIITGAYHVGLNIGPVTFGNPGGQSSAPVQLFIAKYSASGTFLWAKEMDNGLSMGFDVETDEFRNIYLVGVYSHYVTFGGNELDINQSDRSGGFFAKISQHGELISINALGVGSPIALTRTSNGDFYITGSTVGGSPFGMFSIPYGEEQAFVAKLKPDGSFESGMVSSGPAVGYSYRYASNSTVDDQGNVFTIGSYYNRIVFGCDTLLSERDGMFITKYSNLPPVYDVLIAGPEAVCKGTTLSLSATSIPEPVKYLWQIPAGVTVEPSSSITSNSITVRAGVSADFQNITLSVRKGCYQYHASNPYTIRLVDVPATGYLNGPEIFCQQGTARYTINPTQYASEYEWSVTAGMFPQNSSLITTDPYIDLNITDDLDRGEVRVKARNVCGAGESSLPIAVTLEKEPGPIEFITQENKLCNRGQKVTFNTTGAAHATEYVWVIPSIFVESGTVRSNSNSITLTVKDSEEATLTVYGINSCHQNIPATLRLQAIDPLEVPEIIKNDCNTELRVEGELVQWFLNDNVVSGGMPTLQIIDPGEYYATVTNYCGSVASQPVTASPVIAEHFEIPNVITPNDDGKNDFFNLGGDIDGIKLEVFGRWGNTIFSSGDYQNNWDGHEVPTGVYYYKVEHHCLPPYYGTVHVVR